MFVGRVARTRILTMIKPCTHLFKDKTPESLSDIATVIHESMLFFTKENPTNNSAQAIVEYAVGMALRFTKGKANPQTLMAMASMNRAGFEGFNGYLMC